MELCGKILFIITQSEYQRIKSQLEMEDVSEHDIPKMLRARLSHLKGYSAKFKKKVDTKTDIVCMKEDSFYVDAVREFRDRRYEFKERQKEWKQKKNHPDQDDMIVLYNSLQLAHKCILNSFYGYVMRRGSR